MKYGKSSKIKVIMASVPFIIAVFILFSFLLKSTYNMYKKDRLAREKVEYAESELSGLAAREAELQKKVEFLKTEQGMESEMRTKFKAVREGESVAVIIEEKEEEEPINIQTVSSVSWFRKLLGIFTGKRD